MATPRQKKLPAADFAELTGLSDRQLRNIAQKGYFPPPERGEYDEAAALRGMIKYQGELLKKKSTTLTEEKEGLTRVRRLREEFEFEVAKKEYVARDEIGPELRAISMHQRAVLVHKLERELDAKLDGRTKAEKSALLKQAVDDVCAIFNRGVEKWTTEATLNSSAN